MPMHGPIHYRFDGPTDAPVLVLAHSLGLNHRVWDPQVAALGARHRLLRYDLRGHGGSEVTPGPYAVEGLAQDVIDLMDGLGVPRAHFCGLSIGGAIGLWLGRHAPQRLDRLVVANTAARIGTTEGWNRRMAVVAAGGIAAVAPTAVEGWFTADFRARFPDVVAETQGLALAGSLGGFLATCAAVRDMDLRESIGGITAPTLVIAGSHDLHTSPADGRFLAERIPRAQYRELSAGHLSNIEAAGRFDAAVLEFLEA